MAESFQSNHALCTLFRAAVDRAFREHRDLYSPDVAVHIGDHILADFVHVDRIYRLKNAAGKRLEDLPAMVNVAYAKEGPERRLEVDRYIGDFVLFMAGFFPAALRRNRWFAPDPMVARVGKVLVSFSQPLDYYLAEGSNAYSRAAATARLFDESAHQTLQQLGKHIEGYLQLVSLVKQLIEDDPQVRQVEGLIE